MRLTRRQKQEKGEHNARPCLLCLQCSRTHQDHAQNIDQRRCEDDAVKPVHDASMARDQVSVILYIVVSLDR